MTNLDQAAGHLDIFTFDPEKETLHGAGWMLFLDGAPDSIQVKRSDGGYEPVVTIPRPDLAEAWPHVPDSERGGYQFEIPVPGLAPGEMREFDLRVTRGERTYDMALGFRLPAEGYVLPEPEFIQRVANAPSQSYFLASGIRDACSVIRMLRPHRDPNAVGSFLDWGCGCGRVTRHIAGMLKGARIHGVDIDPRAIEWVAETIPDAEFAVAGLMPPLPYEDGTFDLILGSSVFTHLVESAQEAWLAELHRILAPDGVLMATTHGRFAARWVNDSRVSAALEETGFFDGIEDDNLGEVASGDYYRATFQTEEYTREWWGAQFRELAMLQGGLNFHQDMWVLEKR